MTSSRDTVLSRVRAAVGPAPVSPPVPRDYHRSGDHGPGSAEVIELLIDRLVDYKARVSRTTATGLTEAINGALGESISVVVPAGLDPVSVAACGTGARTVVTDGSPDVLTPAALDRIDAVVTAARVAIAMSGTIILDGEPDQGRRAITLVPDRHVIILTAAQVVETVPEAIALIEPARPLTMIAGPSATSDIELERVEGVHGPRTLEVIIVE